MEIEIDSYSKTVLTVIAVMLVWHGIKDFSIVENAMASTGVVGVKVVHFVGQDHELQKHQRRAK